MKEKFAAVCAYCKAEFLTNRASAKYCCASHRVSAFKKAQIAELKRLKGK
jgi:hypothetical protein